MLLRREEMKYETKSETRTRKRQGDVGKTEEEKP